MKKIHQLLLCSLYLLPFFLPTYQTKIPVSSFGSLNWLDIWQIFIIFLFMTFLLQQGHFSQFLAFIKQKSAFMLTIFIFFAGLFLSLLFARGFADLFSGLGLIKSYFLLPLCVALIIAYLVNRQLLEKNGLLFSYFLYCSFLALGGVYCLIAGQLTFDHRLALFYNSPNFLAMTLAPGILISGSYLTDKLALPTKPILGRFLNKKAIFILAAGQMVCLLATQSLGAIIGLLPAFFLVIYPRYIRFILRASLVISLLSVLVILFLPLLIKLFHYTPSVPATSFDSRLAIYQSSQAIIRDHWPTGIGPGNFQKAYLAYQPSFGPYPQWAVPHSHNIFLHIWTELGLISLVGFILLLFLLIRTADISSKRLVFHAMLVYFLLHGLFDMTIWKNDLAQWFWVVIII